jgi:uncharacterized membrane protein YGL010W
MAVFGGLRRPSVRLGFRQKEKTIMDARRSEWMLEQAGMYLAYHRDHRNVLTHVLGVPMIMFAILLLLHRANFGWLSPSYFGGLTLGWIATLGFAVWYLSLERLAGGILALLLVVGSMLAAQLALLPGATFWGLFALFFVGGWIIQLVGHSVFEGRRPALTDNILQVFVAPLFLVLEALFAIGQLQDVKAEIERRSRRYDPVAAE